MTERLDLKFGKRVLTLAPNLQKLLEMKPLKDEQPPQNSPKSAVYLFSEDSENLYVGRTNSLPKRYRQHWVPSADHNQASFAFLLAREKTRLDGRRKQLMERPKFVKAFNAAKECIRKMDFRYVEEADQVNQALLEIYCAIVLKTKYNDFNTH